MYELISDADYITLPEEPELRFAAFESTCRASMTRLITQDTTPVSDRFVRMQYMTTVAGAAEALGIEGVAYPDRLDDPADGLDDFMLSVSRAIAKIKLKGAVQGPHSVRLGAKTRGLIEQQIQKLRNIISEADLSHSRRDALLRRLDELSVELGQTRVSFAKVMSVLVHVGAAVASGTTFLAEAPHAIATITSLLGHDKAAEDAEARRLGSPPKPKALPNPRKEKEATIMAEALAFDDDIPF
jgi:hypothetical protein